MHTYDRNMLPAPAAFACDRGREGVRCRIPLWVCAVALVIAALHMFPYWHAQLAALPGWHFTGNLSSWPDEVQYRVWLRQAPDAGLVVDDRFTSEPSGPFLPVALYYVIGWASDVLSVHPDMAFAYAGAFFAAALTIMIYMISRQFLSTRAAAWTLIVVVFGGGLGAYFKFLELLLWQFKFSRAGAARINQFLQTARVFEDYRENYVIRAIFDSHFAFFWTLILTALLALYSTLRVFSGRKLTLTCAVCMIITLLHVYDGVLLIAIAAGITTLMWIKGTAHTAGPDLASRPERLHRYGPGRFIRRAIVLRSAFSTMAISERFSAGVVYGVSRRGADHHTGHSEIVVDRGFGSMLSDGVDAGRDRTDGIAAALSLRRSRLHYGASGPVHPGGNDLLFGWRTSSQKVCINGHYAAGNHSCLGVARNVAHQPLSARHPCGFR